MNPQSDHASEEHSLELVWGPLLYETKLTFRDGAPMSFGHHKLGRDAVSMFARVEPPAIVTFGEGAAPDPWLDVRQIDEGWTRVAGSPLVRARAIEDLNETSNDWHS